MKPKLNINESFICRIWEGGDEYYSDLQTISGEDVEILDHGTRNYDSGPDYKNAKIKIDGKTLTGDVEIHRDFKNWAEHNHQKDRKYNPVILHVVMWDSDEREEPKLRIKRDLPSVVLSNFLKQSIHDVWQDAISKPSEKLLLPCSTSVSNIDKSIINNWFSKLAEERLQLKTGRLNERLDELVKQSGFSIENKSLWEQLLYEYTFEALGFSKNKEQMLKLTANLTLTKINKLMEKNGSVTYLQAALFGAAGFLFDVRKRDEYIDIVKGYWKLIEPFLNVTKMNRHEWNFFRMRPQNFPTVRLAYGSQLIINILYKDLFRKIVEVFGDNGPDKVHKGLTELFRPDKDDYWQSHYDFDKESAAQNKLIGKQRVDDIFINVIIPLISLYAEQFNNSSLKDKVVSFYHDMKLKPDNSIINLVEKQILQCHKVKPDSPAMEQAAIQLYNFYCMRERCRECEIGKNVFTDKGYEYKIIFY